MPTTTACLTTYTENKLLDHLLRSTAWALPTGYLGLLQGNPTDGGASSAEVTTAGTNGYARQAVGTGGGCVFSAAASGSITTNTNVTWGPSTGGPWGTASYVGMWDALTGGNLIFYCDSTNVAVPTNDSYRITTGNLTLAWTASSALATAIKNSLLDHIVGRTSYSSPTPYIALYNGNPLGAGAEVAVAGADGYARVALAAKMAAASGGSIASNAQIDYGPASADWSDSTYYSIMTASTGGDVILGAPLDSTITVSNGQSTYFASGGLIITLD